MSNRDIFRAALLAAVVCGAWWAPTEAQACGGTFCDNPGAGQPPMPVDQTGENVLFVLADGMVEAHVQIQYSGDPERFGWIIPVPEVPELEVGNQQLMVNLLNGTVPTFSLTSSFDGCFGGSDTSFDSTSGGCGMSAADDSGSSLMDDSAGGSSGTESNSDLAVRKQNVGAFEISILDEGTPAQVAEWLIENDLLDDPDAAPILQDYAEKGHVFVAVRLEAGAGVDEIHPLVIRYPGSEPCVPLKLTAIAAEEDMDIRTFFLGSRRTVPTTYKHVELNPLSLDWLNLGQNYKSAVSRAVDSPVANGRAFITEYAGSSGVVSRDSIIDSRWDHGQLREATPSGVMALLEEWELFTCDNLDCTANHPLLIPMLRSHLPAPAAVNETSFYSCVSCFPEDFDAESWDPGPLADEFEERIEAPAQHALGLLAANPYLTRLYTTISPAEMTEDPMFSEWDGLGDVSASLNATLRTTCQSDTKLTEPEGREVLSPSSSSLGAPAAETVEEFDPDNGRTLLVDNRATIDQQIEQWNSTQSFDETGRTASGGSSEEAEGGGCGCSLRNRRADSAYVLAAALGWFMLRRRRRLWTARRGARARARR